VIAGRRMERFTETSGPSRASPVKITSCWEHVKRAGPIPASTATSSFRRAGAYDPVAAAVLGIRDQLVQVFLNIVKNAAEAIGENAGDGEIPLTTPYGGRAAVVHGRKRGSRGTPSLRQGQNGPGVRKKRPVAFICSIQFVTKKPTGSGLGPAAG